MSRKIREVVAFIDWNSQLYNARARSIQDSARRAQVTLERTASLIEQALLSIDANLQYRVRQRLYHGWHRGLTPTENRRAIDKIQTSDYYLGSVSGRVVFAQPIEFGNRLLAALPHRLRHRSPQIHLPDTLRDDPDTRKPREKMVDTALATDLLVHARTAPADWRIVMAEDDDIIPPLFTAEAWSKDKGGRTILLRQRSLNCPHIDLGGLLVEATHLRN